MQWKCLVLFAVLATAGICLADVVVTVDGARLVGTITRIEEGVVHLDTAYAGTLQVRQDQVASFETADPLFVRLASGVVMAGPVETDDAGNLRIESDDGVMQTGIARVTASWRPGDDDPQIAQLREAEERARRRWDYEAAVDVLGKEGNAREFGVGANFEAVLRSPDDALTFHASYEERKRDGEKTADRLAGGMSYEAFFSKLFGWYVRTELETDSVSDIDLRSTSAAGMSYRLIDKEHQRLVTRTGLGYRYTSYESDTEDESTPTLDLGLTHRYRFRDMLTMRNALTFVPSIEDFSAYTAVHDSGLEIPVGMGRHWKLRLGLRNEYDSDPGDARRLDTTYYSRLVYSWN